MGLMSLESVKYVIQSLLAGRTQVKKAVVDTKCVSTKLILAFVLAELVICTIVSLLCLALQYCVIE